MTNSIYYFMAQEAAKAGAVAINEEVTDVRYSESGKPIVCHEADGTQFDGKRNHQTAEAQSKMKK